MVVKLRGRLVRVSRKSCREKVGRYDKLHCMYEILKDYFNTYILKWEAGARGGGAPHL